MMMTLGCLVLAWSSFWMLSSRQAEQAAADDTHQRSGGMLARWIRYDILIFLVCGGIVCYQFATKDIDDPLLWQTVFWAKALYGILSLPFLIFMLPLVDVLFTHAHVTGYTPSGKLHSKCKPSAATELQDSSNTDAVINSKTGTVLQEMLHVSIDGGALPLEDWVGRHYCI